MFTSLLGLQDHLTQSCWQTNGQDIHLLKDFLTLPLYIRSVKTLTKSKLLPLEAYSLQNSDLEGTSALVYQVFFLS